MPHQSNTDLNAKKGIIFDIQDYAIHDGPGIRTLIFLKGCPLRCKWCSNPEGQLFKPELMHSQLRCKKCGKCVQICLHHAVTITPDEFPRINRKICLDCEDKPCVKTCPSQALRIAGSTITAHDLFNRVRQNSLLYRNSGGGITLSGGEPLTQPEFVSAFLKNCATIGLSVGVETCGFFNWENNFDLLMDLDFVFFDIKCVNSELHKEVTTVNNELILQNLQKLAQLDSSKIIISIPVIPGVNDSEENLLESLEIIQQLGITKIRLLKYHNLGKMKYEELGRLYPMQSGLKLEDERFANLQKKSERFTDRDFMNYLRLKP
ncbi:MAG: glycyl-radical enzyme activating protein [Candidatus Hodarchaeales archaeon]|jgi:pyruvate formate lyase activating enzyme